MEVHIRPFKSTDTSALLELFRDTVHNVNNRDYPPEHLGAWAPQYPDQIKWKERFKSSETIVAEVDRKIVGFGNLEKELSVIGMLYVRKDHQGQGVATALLKKLEKKLKKRGAALASVEASITARPFFEKRGYTLVRETKKMLNGTEFLNFVMEKELTLDEPDLPGKEEKILMETKDKPKDKKPFRWRDLFINKAFDLMIVVAGVSIAFQLNNLKLASDQRSQEKFYLESILVDLDKDLQECAENLGDIRSDKRLIAGYMLKLQKPNPPTDSLGIILFNTIWFETFNGNQDTYATLLASNGLSTLSDRLTRNELTEYYKNYQAIERFDEIYTRLLFELYGYFSPYVDFEKKKIIDPGIVKKLQTKNVLLMALGQLNDSQESYAAMMMKATALKVRIEANIAALK